MVTADEVLAITQAYSVLRESFKEEIIYDKYINAVFKTWEGYIQGLENPGRKTAPVNDAPKPKKPSLAEIDAHFDELWELYPSKRGKNAVSALRRLKLFDVSLESMAKAVKRYTDELEQRGKMEFLLNGSTWFNGRYADYLDDDNFAKIDSAAKAHEEPEKPKNRFDVLTPEEIKSLEDRMVINVANGWINYMAMSNADRKLLRERGLI